MMKRNLVISLVLMLTVLVPLGFALAGGGLTQRKPMPPAAHESASRKTLREEKAKAEDPRPLKERARGKKERYVESANPKKPNAFADLKGLAGDSVAVIIGTPQDNVCKLSTDGRTMTIDYKVAVEHVYKGKLKEGATITVSIPGGVMQFDDGSTAEVKTPWFKKLQQGNAYALFLTQGERPGTYVTTGEAQGVFGIPTTTEDRTVKAHSGLLKDSMWKYNGMNVYVFLNEVKQAVKKNKQA